MKKTTLCAPLAVAVVSIVVGVGADWLRFRGPAGNGVADDTGLPVTWSATEHVVWKTAMPGSGASSPITLGDRVFLTCYSGYGLDPDEPGEQENLLHHVTCIDRATGKIVWDKRSKARLPETEYDAERFLQLHGYASSTPATDGQNVYAFFGRSGVWAYSIDGDLLWRVSVGSGTHGWGSANSPVLAGDLVIVNASVESNAVVALEKATGKEVWRAEGVEKSWSTPVLVELPNGSRELVVSMLNYVRGYDPATGEQLWQCAGVRDYVCPMVVAADGIVYVSGGRSVQTVAVRAGGRGDVTETHRLWEVRKGTKVPSPLVHEGLLYWVDNGGVACCFDAASGESIYRERLDLSGGGDKVYSSVVLADGKLYAVSRKGEAVVLAAGREFKVLAKNDLGDDSIFNATPVVNNGQLLLRSDRFLYCLGN
ncbi:MAG: PQQ-binding-like beta-propeller repeat protein [Pirellulales bacterium]|nr:PQQ-binding-like beta-propeller repeat protein [Pirellulales bacterium]